MPETRFKWPVYEPYRGAYIDSYNYLVQNITNYAAVGDGSLGGAYSWVGGGGRPGGEPVGAGWLGLTAGPEAASERGWHTTFVGGRGGCRGTEALDLLGVPFAREVCMFLRIRMHAAEASPRSATPCLGLARHVLTLTQSPDRPARVCIRNTPPATPHLQSPTLRQANDMVLVRGHALEWFYLGFGFPNHVSHHCTHHHHVTHVWITGRWWALVGTAHRPTCAASRPRSCRVLCMQQQCTHAPAAGS